MICFNGVHGFSRCGSWCSLLHPPNALKTTGATGFRLDAIKHIDRKFLLGFVCLGVYSLPRQHLALLPIDQSYKSETWEFGHVCRLWVVTCHCVCELTFDFSRVLVWKVCRFICDWWSRSTQYTALNCFYLMYRPSEARWATILSLPDCFVHFPSDCILWCPVAHEL